MRPAIALLALHSKGKDWNLIECAEIVKSEKRNDNDRGQAETEKKVWEKKKALPRNVASDNQLERG